MKCQGTTTQPVLMIRAWILDVMLLALVSNVTLLVWLSNFLQCWLPCARLYPVARIPWAPSTAQILKVTLIEWLLKLTLLASHQVFTPYRDFGFFSKIRIDFRYKSKIEIRHQIIKTILKWNFSEFNAISYWKGPHKIMISVIRLGEIET